MTKPWDITGDDLVRWSQQYDAPGVLPDLVRRLLLATSPISSITMNAHAGTRLRDWDGVVRSFAETAFCPAGVSVWELTVEGDKGKLTDDFRKRAEDKGSFDPSRTSYVAVSARRLAQPSRWEAERRGEKIWRDVRLLHAEDLAAWLATAPAVARWFAGKVGHPAADAEDLDGFLEGWCRRTRVRLPVEIAVAGQERQQLAESVRAWARSVRGDGVPLRVYGDTWEEGAVFTAAALAEDLSPEGDQVRARTIVVRSEEALRSALRAEQVQPLIVIAAFPNASADVGAAVLTREGAAPAGAFDGVRLGPVPYRRFAEILVRAGMSEEEAGRVASGSGGKVRSLQRLLGYVDVPAWAERVAPVPLSAMLLVGAFEPANPEDREVLAWLGADPGEVELLCERLRLVPDAPTHKEEGRAYRPVWTWRAPEDAWKALVGQIPAETLRKFAEVVRLVLGERDPSLDLKPDERFAAELQGKTLRASGPLREGLVRSLVRLSLSDEALAPLHGAGRGSGLAMLAVRDLLPAGWEAWASVSGFLPLLAEAAPERFLDCVEASLREGETGVAHLLAEEASMGGSPHTGLLWALETLGWDEKLMPRVASALARLAEYDEKLERPGRLANRPKRSLEGLLRIAFWQTNASTEDRIREMRRRLQETHKIAFSVLVDQITAQDLGGVVDRAHKPVLCRAHIPNPEEQSARTQRDFAYVAEAYVNLALEHVGNEADRWAYLLHGARAFTKLGIRLLERLEQVQSLVRDDKAEVWGAIRHILRSLLADEAHRISQQRWEVLYDAFRPQNPTLLYGWLFRSGAALPKPFDQAHNFHTEQQILEDLRTKAIEDIGGRSDRFEILGALAQMADTRDLGSTMGKATFVEDLDSYLLDGLSLPPYFAPQLGAYMAVRQSVSKHEQSSMSGDEWIVRKVHAMLDRGRRGDAETVILQLPTNRATWNLVDSLGEEFCQSYWKNVRHGFGRHSAEDWQFCVGRLLAAGNVVTALKSVWLAQLAQEGINIGIIANVLSEVVGATPEEAKRIQADQGCHAALELLAGHLKNSSEADAKYAVLLASLELIHALGTSKSTRSMRYFSTAMASDPDHFIGLVKQMYHRSDEPRLELDLADQEEASNRAEVARRILEAWKGYPGEGLLADDRENILYDWSLRVLRVLVTVGRPDTGASEVARVLARAPVSEDGCWPCIAARRIIDLDEFPKLGRSLNTAKRNLRGVTVRSLSEGGKQERELATGFRDNAKKLRVSWPRTADMLDGLADSYDSDAVREDAEAQATMRQAGAEPKDFEEPPPRPSPSPKRRVVSPGIVRLQAIDLTDLTLFDRLTLTLTPPTDRGQWIVLLGENGSGKSTILRAIVLALAGTNVAQAALGQYEAPLIRMGQDAARAALTRDGDTFSTVISDDGTGEAAACTPSNGARPRVFAYGCRRGSALSGNDSVDLASAFSDVATLFSDSARLHPARTWLKELKLRALQDPRHDHVFRTVSEKLCAMLPDVDRLDIVDNHVWAIAPKLGGRVRLASLSDGYLTTLGWIADLIARWLHWAEQVGESTEGDFFARMEGLVLVDEIDLHLHPRWQRTIIRKLKEIFPRLSFVVTTHNPLTLVGADPGEIVVLRGATDGSGHPEAKQIDLPPGIRADRILTGEWFGLPYTVDDDTIALIEDHQRMLLDQVPIDAPERAALEEKLAARYGTYADTSIDRMALEVAAELMRERRPKTPEDRADLQRRLKERVRQRLAEKDPPSGAKS